MSLPLPPLAYPGLPLAPTSTHTPGPGTHIHNKQIIASLSGRPTILPSPPTTKPSQKPTVTIPPPPLSQTHPTIPSSAVTATTLLPTLGADVLALVTRVRTRQVDLSILCVATTPSPTTTTTNNKNNNNTTTPAPTWHPNPHPYPAVLRVEDIRATASSSAEPVTTHESFRVGDVVRAGVLSLGDQAQGWYLSTGRNEWGVLMAWEGAAATALLGGGRGGLMVPVSWKEMRDGRGRGEERKVARPF